MVCMADVTEGFNQTAFHEIAQIWQQVSASSADASIATISDIMPLSNPTHKLLALPNLPLM